MGAIKWVKPLCFGAVLVLLGDTHALVLSIQGGGQGGHRKRWDKPDWSWE